MPSHGATARPAWAPEVRDSLLERLVAHAVKGSASYNNALVRSSYPVAHAFLLTSIQSQQGHHRFTLKGGGGGGRGGGGVGFHLKNNGVNSNHIVAIRSG